MRLKLIFFILFLCLPIVYSDISLTNLNEAYNLGEEIILKADVELEEDFNGFEEATIVCEDYSKTYHTKPVTMYASQTKNIEISTLSIFQTMEGKCRIKLTFESIDGSVVATENSDEFEITDRLIVDLDKSDFSLNPSDILTLTGKLYNIRDEPIGGILRTTLADQDVNYVLPDSDFSIDITVPENIKSGENRVLLTFEDNGKNYKDKLIKLNIIPNPSRISVEINDDLYLPYEKLRAGIYLLDQANDTIASEDLNIKILKEKKEVYSDNHLSGIFTYPLNNSLEPGEYILAAEYAEIQQEASFEIASLQQIESKLEDQTAVITNTGNVDYKNSTIILLFKGEGGITIEKKVSLKPGESYELDLSKEVEEGNYSVLLPNGEKIDEVYVDDNRNIFKKATSGFADITGNIVANGESIKSTITLVFLILFLIIIVAIAVLQYQGYPIMHKIAKSSKSILSKFKKK